MNEGTDNIANIKERLIQWGKKFQYVNSFFTIAIQNCLGEISRLIKMIKIMGPLVSFQIRNCTHENDITPYIHVFIFHTPEFLESYGSLKPFSMDGVELMNRKQKLLFFGGTDHGRENCMSEQVCDCIYTETMLLISFAHFRSLSSSR